jgi:low temperature requirement protein LtrA
VAVAVDAAGPALATLRRDKLPLHIEHLPERFALLVILVLGEAVGGGVRGVHEAHWAGPAVAVAAAGFAVAGALWWIYFDIGARGSADELQEAEEDSAPEKEAVDERHDLFVYGHLPMTFGVVLAGVGIEELVLHPGEPVPSAYGWLLATGLGLFLGGVAMILGGTQRSWRAVWPWPVAAVPLVLAIALAPTIALLLTGGYAVSLIALAIGGTRRSRR